MKIINTAIALLIVLLCLNCEATDIGAVNKKVSAIDKAISAGNFQSIVIQSETVSEGVPPAYRYYHDNGDMKLVQITVGHETWSVTHSYYYWENGFLMKYLKQIEGRPDNPEREAIIYDDHGKEIWKNTEGLPITSERVLGLFKDYRALSKAFSQY